MPTLPEGARAIDPEAEAARLIEERNRRASADGWSVICDGIHQADGFVFVRIRVTAEKMPPGRLRSDLGDQLAEVIRANWPQGEVGR